MKIIKPSFIIEDEINGNEILCKIEKSGRTCYKSEDKITNDSAVDFVKMIIKNGHESVLEHEKITVRIICDRGVTHELVRHRIASYSQESTRYCNYGNKITVIQPSFFRENDPVKQIPDPPGDGYVPANKFVVWAISMNVCEWAYKNLLDLGATPQEARSVLPNSLKTEIVVTMNLREWRHFFKLRTSKSAHPQMREITIPMLEEFKRRIPVIFDDIKVEI